MNIVGGATFRRRIMKVCQRAARSLAGRSQAERGGIGL